ncbi:phorbol esters/diacylglycerol binding domain protein [Trichuris suis]|nr:phorbol esters/diacylglycerol binding domain protein [Trichuris suis]
MLQLFAQSSWQHWSECNSECQLLQKELMKQEEELTSLRNEFQEEKAKLLECRSDCGSDFVRLIPEESYYGFRSQLSTVLQERQALLTRNCFLQSKVKSVRSMLELCTEITNANRFQLENLLDNSKIEDCESLSSATEIDFDQTDDRCIMKGTTKLCGFSIHLRRIGNSAPDLRSIDFTNTSDNNGNLPTENSEKIEWPMRTLSERIGLKSRRVFQPKNVNANRQGKRPVALDVNPSITCLISCLSKRTHMLLCKTVIRTETCHVCESRICFGKSAMRCLNCLMLCHKECLNNAVSFCIPNTSSSRKMRGRLVDYVPQSPPYIPQLLVHCLVEIERRNPIPFGLYETNDKESARFPSYIPVLC